MGVEDGVGAADGVGVGPAMETESDDAGSAGRQFGIATGVRIRITDRVSVLTVSRFGGRTPRF